MCPPNIQISSTRLKHPKWNAVQMIKNSNIENTISVHNELWDDFNNSIERILKTDPNILSFACKSGSFIY